MARLSSVFLCLVLVLSPLHVSAAMYSDVSSSPYAPAIEFMSEEGMVEGYSDGTFRPFQPINRAEFTKLVIESIGTIPEGSHCFRDVRDEWYARYVCAARARGLITGYADGAFRPEQTVTVGEAAAIIIRSKQINVPPSNPWYQSYMTMLQSWNALPNFASANAALTRGEMTEILYRVHLHDNDQPVPEFDEPTGPLSQLDLNTFFEYDDDDIDDLEDEDDLPNDQVTARDLMNWDYILMGLMKRRVVPAPLSARIYAAVAIAQHDAVILADEVGASSRAAVDQVSMDVICFYFPQDCNDVQIDVDDDDFSERLAEMIRNELLPRLQQDIATPVQLAQPNGTGFWQGTNPVGTFAVQWQYLLADEDDFDVDEPHEIGSDDDEDELDDVMEALEDLTAEQLAAIAMWDYPEDISVPFIKIAHDFLHMERADAVRGAQVRLLLFTGISDGMTASWKSKFEYWTARPSQRDSRIDPVIANPNYPAFPSEYATLGGVAVEILGFFYPEHRNKLEEIAETASESRVWAGVQVETDNKEGMELGRDVAESLIEEYEDL